MKSKEFFCNGSGYRFIAFDPEKRELEIALFGELTLLELPGLEGSLLRELVCSYDLGDFETLNLNLAGLNFISSHGFNFLLKLLKLARSRGFSLKLSHLNPETRDLFSLLSLDQIFDLSKGENLLKTTESVRILQPVKIA